MAVIDNIGEALDRALALILLPATLYGAGGAFIRARHKGKSIGQTVLEVFGGAMATNMLCPLVRESTPESWHYTLFFFVGWGGLELMGRVYDATAGMLERRISKRFSDKLK